MKEVLLLITINVADISIRACVLIQASFPHRICDFPLPQCNTGYACMLMSVKDKSFTYIGQTIRICKRIQ